MKKTLWDLIKLSLPMGREKHRIYAMASLYLDQQDVKELKYYLKMDRTFGVVESFHTTKEGSENSEISENDNGSLLSLPDAQWPLFKTHRDADVLQPFLDRINADMEYKAKEKAFLRFAPHALPTISERIAPNIIGMDSMKRVAVAQLFANEPLHLLLLGDPGTGKTDILRGVAAIAPVASMGLGSGTSGAGLSAMAKGDTLIKGLLPLADGGIACIDELNLMKSKDAAALYNAMEKGFVTYDKGGKHEQLSAKVRVCATANPEGDTFIGRSAESLKKQIPFDDALLSRFHIVFIIRKPTPEEFERITTHIVQHHTGSATGTVFSQADVLFLKAYIAYAQKIDVKLDPALESHIVSFISTLKNDERKFIVEVGPRMVIGVLRLAKAIARAELAQAVTKEHLDVAFSLVKESLYVRKPDESKPKDDAHSKKKEKDEKT